MVKDYTKEVTHKDYRNPEKLKKYYHRVEKKYYPKFKTYDLTESIHKEFKLINDEFISLKYPNWVTPTIGGGLSLLFLLPVLKYTFREGINAEYLVLIILFSSLLSFFSIYGITQPQKEQILDRKNGLLTMTGFFWQKSITMVFDKVEFAYSTGGEDAVGGFVLQAIRPNKWQTFDNYEFYGDCYNTMTFIMWYMDKNRPLPPDPVFDPYRQQDFERRKAAGFPKPLYPSSIKTPEATKEQRAERKRIGGW